MIVCDKEKVNMLNHLRFEVVWNAATNISSRKDVTISDLRELLDIIEDEALAVARFLEASK